MSEIKPLVAMIKEEIHTVLALKTSWGRNELELQIERAINMALIRYLDGER